jgi:hypothetical protein
MRQALVEDLDNPRSIDCLMVKTPMKKVNKTYTTVFFMWFLMFTVYAAIILFIFPRKLHFHLHLVYPYMEAQILFCLSLFCITFVIHLIVMCKDPGFLKKPTGVTFMQLLE